MNEAEWLAEQFDAQRNRLRGVAYRMLGSSTEADDAVQEVWLRVTRSEATGIENLGGWLTTVTARVCLDMLRSRKSRREESFEEHVTEASTMDGDPEDQVVLADSIGVALLVVLETLAPAERVAFVLHDMFDVPFDEIAPVLDRSPAATRQLASRARRRVQGADKASEADRALHHQIVDAFLAASRSGDMNALLALLHPEAVARADAAAVATGASPEVRGAQAVAETFSGRARAARPALIDGAPGLVWSRDGIPRVAFAFSITAGKIVAIDLIADPERLEQLR